MKPVLQYKTSIYTLLLFAQRDAEVLSYVVNFEHIQVGK